MGNSDGVVVWTWRVKEGWRGKAGKAGYFGWTFVYCDYVDYGSLVIVSDFLRRNVSYGSVVRNEILLF